ncbi:MAG TPA: fumarylacetoacetase [Candidatus Krumholzibacteria bacterium]|nr:fumarylacetoacetase [Candidatus Krumholzibacteria bacterium]
MSDPTVDPGVRSFVTTPPDSHFPLQNLPWGVFTPAVGGAPRVGTRVGDTVVDVAALADAGLLAVAEVPADVFGQPSLNAFMAVDAARRRRVRRRLHDLLRADAPTLRDDAALRARALHAAGEVTMHLPVVTRDYTDFYSSREHATNVGIMFRGKDNALMPNWLHLPVGYHGRASSLVVSGTPVVRPCGQTQPADGQPPVFGPCRLMDFELEMGFYVAAGNALGEPVGVDEAMDRIFGLVLVNDWSARDIQKWEYQPLGPFNAKNFATSVSPWVVTLDALAPFRCAAPAQDPAPLPYLAERDRHTFDIRLEVAVKADGADEGLRVCASNFRHLYWTMAQQLAHHTVTGCNLGTGDLLASGTISGPDKGSFGSMLEITWRGTEPVVLPGGAERRFLADGDTVTMTGWCQGEGYRVGFGEVGGRVLPARTKA